MCAPSGIAQSDATPRVRRSDDRLAAARPPTHRQRDAYSRAIHGARERIYREWEPGDHAGRVAAAGPNLIRQILEDGPGVLVP